MEHPVAPPHDPKMTAALLLSYSSAALSNAADLLVEATLLFNHGHIARAYFLAIASIEESGKALQAFDAQTRNLADPAVRSRLKNSLQSHEHKITYALGLWALNSADPHAEVKLAAELISHLKRGREPSMYSELRADPDRAQTPREVVRPKAAQDCVTLAGNCLAHARHHVSSKMPATFTFVDDRLFTMKAVKFQAILNTEDFWWYYISMMEAGQQSFAEAVMGYERDYISTGVSFNPSIGDNDAT